MTDPLALDMRVERHTARLEAIATARRNIARATREVFRYYTAQACGMPVDATPREFCNRLHETA